ncbi:MAG: leucine-rich repeat protein [Oscillospiraceae bacterium]|nr:leucine-rich repeat protein [Oscillospiraceae bacterium]
MKNFLSTTKGKIIAGAVTLALIAGVIVLIILLNMGYRNIRVADLTGTSRVTSMLSVSDAFKGQNLVSGDNVEVFEKSSLTLALDSDKHVVASELTKFSVEAFGAEGKDTRTIIHLETGTISNQIDNKLLPSESYVVESPNASMSVRGTIFTVNVYYDNNGRCHTAVEVKEGTVELTEKGTDKVKTLNAGESASVVSRVENIENSSVNSSGNSGGNGSYSPVSDFEYKYNDELGGIEITKYIGNDEVVNVPAEIEGKPVVVVGGFSESNVTSVTIPDGCKEIKSLAFFRCEELTSVEVPDSVTKIHDGAFKLCKKLKSVRIPDGVTSIEIGVFHGCEELTDITIPNSVKEIKLDAFNGCCALKSIEIPDSVTSIGQCAFSGGTGLKSITIPGSVTRIGEYAFVGIRLTSLIIENGVKEIGKGAFESCAEIMSIEIPDSVTKIEEQAFLGCKATITYKGRTYTEDNYSELYTE